MTNILNKEISETTKKKKEKNRSSFIAVYVSAFMFVYLLVMCTKCMPYPLRPEGGVRFPRAVAIGAFELHDGNPDPCKCP